MAQRVFNGLVGLSALISKIILYFFCVFFHSLSCFTFCHLPNGPVPQSTIKGLCSQIKERKFVTRSTIQKLLTASGDPAKLIVIIWYEGERKKAWEFFFLVWVFTKSLCFTVEPALYYIYKPRTVSHLKYVTALDSHVKWSTTAIIYSSTAGKLA